MKICYSGKSAPSAQAIADEDETFTIVRDGDGDINWGRYKANTKLNPDIRNSTNKRRMRELFAENDVPMPKLYSYNEMMEHFEKQTPPLKFIGRPDKHTKGRGLWVIDDYESLRRALRGTRKKQPATHFMEFVEASHELRVHIFQGKSIRISEKSFFIDENGKKDYTTIKPTIKRKRVRRAAKKAVKALGLDFGAVDILATDDNTPYVLEVNSSPGLGGSMPALYAKVFKEWYDNTANETP